MKKIVYIVIILIIIIAFVGKILYIKSDLYKYNKAKNRIEKEQYEEAIIILNEISSYKDSEELLLNSKLEIVNNLIEEEKIEEALNELNAIGKDVNETTRKVYIDLETRLADAAYKKGDFKEAKTHYENANVDEEMKKKCEVMLSIQGTYDYYVVINGWIMYIQDNYTVNKEVTKTYFTLSDSLDKIITINKTEFAIEKDLLTTQAFNYLKQEYETVSLHKTSEDNDIPKEIPEPKIGMTKEEVKKSTWKMPSKINTDTYSWGTTEQWVYPGKGYIYFKNGIVSSISENK